MKEQVDRANRFGRRGTLRVIGALAGVGLVASLGSTSALAQQQGGMPGMGATPTMGGVGQSGMMGGMPSMKSGMPAMMEGMMMGGLMGPNADRVFIQEMIPHHQAAVAMATMALAHVQRPEIKALAETIVRTQNWEIEHMAALHRNWFGTPVPPGKMPAMMAASGMHPSAMAGAKMDDKTFLEMMSMHHQMAVMMASMALGAHQHPELAKLQQTMISDQAREIGEMRAWHRAWYPAG